CTCQSARPLPVVSAVPFRQVTYNRTLPMILECHRIIFQGIASIIVARPASVLTTTLLVSLVVSMGNIYIRFKDNFRAGYSEPNAPSLAEHLAYRSFYDFTSSPYMIGLVGECEEGDSMLRVDVFKLMRKDIDLGLSTIIPNDDPTDQRHTLRDYCIFSSEAHFSAIEESINYHSENIHIEYPNSTVFAQRLSMRRIMYGVKNGSLKILFYTMMFQPESPDILAKIKSAELAWYQRLEKQESSLLRLHLFGDELVDNEILVGSVSTIPYLVVGGVLMLTVAFCALTRYNQSFISTIGLLLWTAMCPMLAGIMAIAIFSFRGVAVNCMMFITPFLVLGVGVDDAFLMIHNWFHSTEVDGSSRLSTMLVEVGPSVTLTSFTNVVAFLASCFH
uniref:SSD domain-containing protein n=1 Tax=Parascaris univalens TaxID=6257 RepID=A0A915BTC9_PARUN